MNRDRMMFTRRIGLVLLFMLVLPGFVMDWLIRFAHVTGAGGAPMVPQIAGGVIFLCLLCILAGTAFYKAQVDQPAKVNATRSLLPPFARVLLILGASGFVISIFCLDLLIVAALDMHLLLETYTVRFLIAHIVPGCLQTWSTASLLAMACVRLGQVVRYRSLRSHIDKTSNFLLGTFIATLVLPTYFALLSRNINLIVIGFVCLVLFLAAARCFKSSKVIYTR